MGLSFIKEKRASTKTQRTIANLVNLEEHNISHRALDYLPDTDC